MAPIKFDKSLFVFAHPDDELAVVITLKRMREEGVEVHCVWVTDGRITADPKVREEEAGKVMNLLGVPKDNLNFLRYEDGQSVYSMKEIIDALSKIIKKVNPHQIYVDAFEGGHMDHDTTHFTTVQAVKRLDLNIPLYEFPQYNNYYKFIFKKYATFIPDKEPIQCLPLTWSDLFLKLKILRMYSSQKNTIRELLIFFLFNIRKIKRGETFRKIPEARDYLRPPHQGELLYQILFKFSFSTFAAKVREEVEQQLDA